MTKRIRIRSLMVGIIFTLAFGFLLYKIYHIQVVEAAWLKVEADKRWEQDKVLPANRGVIYDRNQQVLATDTTVYSISLNPKLLDANQIVDEVVNGLTEILNTSNNQQVRSALANKIKDKATKRKADGSFHLSVEIRNEGWKISKTKADQITVLAEKIKLAHELRGNIGIYLKEEKGRYYPGGSLASHILGYLDKEGNAKLGIELKLDDVLAGIPGEMKVKTDAKGVEVLDSRQIITPAVNGNHVQLTIDKNIQFYIENAMATVQKKYNPKSISVVALDPATMEIIGMANTPTFDPNAYWEITDLGQFKNQAISSQFEPGSTFKLVTLAEAVEEGLYKQDDMYVSGSIEVPGATLHDHNRIGWGKITYLEGLKRSSNVEFVKLGYETLGPEKLVASIENFGFGQKTNVDMNGEVASPIYLQYPAEFATATYGQGKVVTTNLQIATAYGAIANGGNLMWPHVIKEIIDSSSGKVKESFVPRVIRRVVSEQTAKQVSAYLEQTVSDQKLGTGKAAYIPGYHVAGKTGTANIVSEDGKGYVEGQWLISFVGYAPADDPKILISIMIQEPDLGGNYHLASSITGSMFKEMMLQSLQYLGVPADNQQVNISNPVDSVANNTPFVGLTKEAAKLQAEHVGYQVNFMGIGNEVLEQYPKPSDVNEDTQTIYLLMQARNQVTVPAMNGKSTRETIEVCTFLQAHCQFSGYGYVVDQHITEVGKVKTFNFKLQPLHDKVIVSLKP